MFYSKIYVYVVVIPSPKLMRLAGFNENLFSVVVVMFSRFDSTISGHVRNLAIGRI